MIEETAVKKGLSLWSELENLQKKKTELECGLISLEERSKILEQKLKESEGRVNTLMELLKTKNEVAERLETTIVDLERKLKKPEKESEKTLEVALASTN